MSDTQSVVGDEAVAVDYERLVACVHQYVQARVVDQGVEKVVPAGSPALGEQDAHSGLASSEAATHEFADLFSRSLVANVMSRGASDGGPAAFTYGVYATTDATACVDLPSSPNLLSSARGRGASDGSPTAPKSIGADDASDPQSDPPTSTSVAHAKSRGTSDGSPSARRGLAPPVEATHELTDPPTPNRTVVRIRSRGSRGTSDSSPCVSGRASMQPQARKLLSKFNLREAAGDFETGALQALSHATFEDARWIHALSHIKESDYWSRRQEMEELVRCGARSFGFWHLPDEVLDVLTGHVLEEAPTVTPALQSWIDEFGGGEGAGPARPARSPTTMTTQTRRPAALLIGAAKVGHAAWAPKLALLAVISAGCAAYACEVCWVMYPGVIRVFGFPIFFARACGIGTLFWTALLFLSMSRTCFKAVAACVPCAWVHSLIDKHKEVHVFSGQMLMIFGAVHTLAHCIGTVPGLISHSLDEVNAILGCANRDSTKGYLGVSFAWLQYPDCPLTTRPSFLGALFKSTPGLTGIGLVLVAAAIGYTAKESKRRRNFEAFYYVHSVGMPLWLLLLFAHGSNGWVGIGFPLVAIVCAIPVLCYMIDRVLRLLRFYLFAGKTVRILDMVIRPGVGGGAKAALINLAISKPPFLWRFSEGMYAFLNLPDYAPYQWHPFTVCSGKHDDTVDFLIHAVGDWTAALAKQCIDAYDGKRDFPRVALDGPYLAPTVTALSHPVLVAVGAGVGITPFLSLLSTLIAVLENDDRGIHLPLQEAHFFWMTRSADELLFGRRHFTKIMASRRPREKIFLHLHVTQREPEKDAAGFIFREAVRRQSRKDREAFRAASARLSAEDLAVAPRLPRGWMAGSKADVIWVKALVELADGDDANHVAAAHETHWSAGVAAAPAAAPPAESDADGVKRRGLFGRSSSTMQSQSIAVESVKEEEAWMPVSFGRPDFDREIEAIGRARPGDDVHVYVCGNSGLVESLQEVCARCTSSAEKTLADGSRRRPQRFVVRYERFE